MKKTQIFSSKNTNDDNYCFHYKNSKMENIMIRRASSPLVENRKNITARRQMSVHNCSDTYKILALHHSCCPHFKKHVDNFERDPDGIETGDVINQYNKNPAFHAENVVNSEGFTRHINGFNHIKSNSPSFISTKVNRTLLNRSFSNDFALNQLKISIKNDENNNIQSEKIDMLVSNDTNDHKICDKQKLQNNRNDWLDFLVKAIECEDKTFDNGYESNRIKKWHTEKDNFNQSNTPTRRDDNIDDNFQSKQKQITNNNSLQNPNKIFDENVNNIHHNQIYSKYYNEKHFNTKQSNICMNTCKDKKEVYIEKQSDICQNTNYYEKHHIINQSSINGCDYSKNDNNVSLNKACSNYSNEKANYASQSAIYNDKLCNINQIRKNINDYSKNEYIKNQRNVCNNDFSSKANSSKRSWSSMIDYNNRANTINQYPNYSGKANDIQKSMNFSEKMDNITQDLECSYNCSTKDRFYCEKTNGFRCGIKSDKCLFKAGKKHDIQNDNVNSKNLYDLNHNLEKSRTLFNHVGRNEKGQIWYRDTTNYIPDKSTQFNDPLAPHHDSFNYNVSKIKDYQNLKGGPIQNAKFHNLLFRPRPKLYNPEMLKLCSDYKIKNFRGDIYANTRPHSRNDCEMDKNIKSSGSEAFFKERLKSNTSLETCKPYQNDNFNNQFFRESNLLSSGKLTHLNKIPDQDKSINSNQSDKNQNEKLFNENQTTDAKKKLEQNETNRKNEYQNSLNISYENTKGNCVGVTNKFGEDSTEKQETMIFQNDTKENQFSSPENQKSEEEQVGEENSLETIEQELFLDYKETVDLKKARYKCKLEACNKTYATKSGLFYHNKHGHQGKTIFRPFKCKFENCEKEFKNSNGLKYHLRKVHDIIVKYSKCQRSYSYQKKQ